MRTVFEVASYIANRYFNTYGVRIEEMTLHKLLYFTYRESLILSGDPMNASPMFDVNFEGWRFGPVVPAIREHYANDTFDKTVSDNDMTEYKKLMDYVFAEYAKKECWSLSRLSVGEFCWKQSRRGIGEHESSNNPINLEDIRVDAQRIYDRRNELRRLGVLKEDEPTHEKVEVKEGAAKTTAFDIASYIVSRYQKEFGERIEEMKLHRLLYFAQREYLAKNDKFMFDEPFYAWRLGPVMPDLRIHYEHNTFKSDISDDDVKEYKSTIDSVFEKYADRDALALARSSREEICWKKARRDFRPNDSSNVPINNDDIRLDALRQIGWDIINGERG